MNKEPLCFSCIYYLASKSKCLFYYIEKGKYPVQCYDYKPIGEGNGKNNK
jgi:hypothetical protein